MQRASGISSATDRQTAQNGKMANARPAIRNSYRGPLANGTASVAVDRDSNDDDDVDLDEVHLAAAPGRCGVLNPTTDVGATTASETKIQSFMMDGSDETLPCKFYC